MASSHANPTSCVHAKMASSLHQDSMADAYVSVDAGGGTTQSPVSSRPRKIPLVYEIGHGPANPKTALVTGLTGLDGSHLAEYLLDLGYEVHGTVRRSSGPNQGRLEALVKKKKLILHHGDLTDSCHLFSVIATVRPSEVYNLAAQSHVQLSFVMPEFTAQCDAFGCLRLLDALRACGLTKHTRLFQASSAELFGKATEVPQTEATPFHPCSPYAVAKLYAYWCCVNYREAYGMFACNGLLYNHESPRRGPDFVTRKIARTVARISKDLERCLYLGNINARKDWGHAIDFIKGMHLMLQHHTAQDYILATGKQHSVREFAQLCFKHVDIDLQFRGEGLDEVGFDATNPDRVLLRIDPQFFRPLEPSTAVGNPSRAEKELGWKRSYAFEDIAKEMMEYELNALSHAAH